MGCVRAIQHTIIHRMLIKIINDMKITALIEDNLIQEVIATSGAKNITEALKITLNDCLSRRKLVELEKDITTEPIEFYYGEDQLRESNQR
jgi:hypothetical protein